MPGPNRDLLSIEMSRLKFRSWIEDGGYDKTLPPKELDKFRSDKESMEIANTLWNCKHSTTQRPPHIESFILLSGSYPRSGILAKMAWYSDHMWFYRPYWNVFCVPMIATVSKRHGGDVLMGIKPTDWSAITTMLINTSSERVSHSSPFLSV